MRIITSNSYKQDKECELYLMGRRVGEEVKEVIKVNKLKVLSVSFIGYALGGVVARTCLKYLDEYQHVLLLYMSVCSYVGRLGNGQRGVR